MENYKCNDCGNKWETLPTWEKPTCNVCGEHLNVEEITDQNDASKIKTFTPLLPEGRGPTGLYSQDALYDILYSLEENNSSETLPEEFERLVEKMNKLLNLDDLIDGEYTLFADYKIKIETMAKTRFDEMPEFNGY